MVTLVLKTQAWDDRLLTTVSRGAGYDVAGASHLSLGAGVGASRSSGSAW